MKNCSNVFFILMGVIAVASVINGIIGAINGDYVRCKTSFMLSLICLTEIKLTTLEAMVYSQHKTIGAMIEALGLLCRIEVVEDEE